MVEDLDFVSFLLDMVLSWSPQVCLPRPFFISFLRPILPRGFCGRLFFLPNTQGNGLPPNTVFGLAKPLPSPVFLLAPSPPKPSVWDLRPITLVIAYDLENVRREVPLRCVYFLFRISLRLSSFLHAGSLFIELRLDFRDYSHKKVYFGLLAVFVGAAPRIGQDFQLILYP